MKKPQQICQARPCWCGGHKTPAGMKPYTPEGHERFIQTQQIKRGEYFTATGP